ncbi:MAG: ABC transporter ATP-binding protein, partial [Ruminiclostridium sp.]|nr:ABC transporter ATP-binding protein [Ruminiclostridium sp.]
EAQRAAIARAMINDPSLIFADEPTGALNKANSDEVLGLLTDLNRKGQSILMVTHDVRAAVRGNRILYLEDGQIMDELSLPLYNEAEEKERAEKTNLWLSSLRW